MPLLVTCPQVTARSRGISVSTLGAWAVQGSGAPRLCRQDGRGPMGYAHAYSSVIRDAGSVCCAGAIHQPKWITSVRLAITAMGTCVVRARVAMRDVPGSRAQRRCMHEELSVTVSHLLTRHCLRECHDESRGPWGVPPPQGVQARQGLASASHYVIKYQSTTYVRIT